MSDKSRKASEKRKLKPFIDSQERGEENGETTIFANPQQEITNKLNTDEALQAKREYAEKTAKRREIFPRRPVRIRKITRLSKYARRPRVVLPDIKKIEYPASEILKLLWLLGAQEINEVEKTAGLLGIKESIRMYLSKLKEEGYITINKNTVFLTDKGIIACYSLNKAPKNSQNLLSILYHGILYDKLVLPKLEPEESLKLELVPLDSQRLKIVKEGFPRLVIPRINVESRASLSTIKFDTSRPIVEVSEPKPLIVPRPVYEEPIQIELVKMDKELFVGEKISDEGQEIPLFPESFVKLISKNHVSGIARVNIDGPVYVVVDKRNYLHELILQLCALLLRIRGPRKPSVWSAKSMAEWQDLIKSETLIIREDIAELLAEFAKSRKIKGQLSSIKEWMRKLYLEQVLRFVVIPADSELLDPIVNVLSGPDLGLYVGELLVYRGEWNEAARRAFSAAYGFVRRPDELIDFREAPKLVEEMDNRIRKIMENLRKKIKSQYYPVPGGKLGEGESWTHYALKWFVMYHLVSRGLARAEEISYERSLGEIISDIYVNNLNLAVEIEMFYGVGEPETKLNEKLRKYDSLKNYKLWVVIPNTQALLFAENILKLRKDYRETGLDVEVFVLDLTGYGHELIYGKKSKPGLIELSKVVNWLRKNAN